MKYFLRKKKWMAWVIMLTFLFTSIMPSNLMAGNSVAEAASYDATVTAGGTVTLDGNTDFPRTKMFYTRWGNLKEFEYNNCTWSSSNSAVATVVGNGKTATVKASGNVVKDTVVTITATATYERNLNSDQYVTKTWNVFVTGNGGSSGEKATITFNRNGGSGTAPAAITGEHGAEVVLPDSSGMTAPRGQVFVGWSTSSTANGTGAENHKQAVYPAGSSYTVIQNDTLYAIWGKQNVNARFFIRKDGNIPVEPSGAGEGDYSDHTVSGMYIQGAIKVEKFVADSSGVKVVANLNQQPSDAALTAALRNINPYNSNFDPDTQKVIWYVMKYVACGDKYGNEWHVDGVIVDKRKAVVNYDANCIGYEGIVPDGNSYELPNQVIVEDPASTAWNLRRPGYTFEEWNTKSDGTGSTYNIGDTLSLTTNDANKTITLYAIWKPNNATKYTVNHYWQNVEQTGYALYEKVEKSGKTDSVVNVPDQTKTYAGFEYNAAKSEYSKNGASSTVITESNKDEVTIAGDGSLVINLYYDRKTATGAEIVKVDQNEQPLGGATFTFAGNALTATAPTTGVVEKVANFLAGEDAVKNIFDITQTLKYGEVYKITETTTPTGYTGVASFYVTLNADATALVVCDAQGNAFAVPTGVSINDLTVTVTNEANAANIVFVENGGTLVDDMTGITDEVIEDTSMPETTRTGYTFDGWYANADLTGEAVTALPDKYPAGTTTYYAKWTPNDGIKYTVEYYYQQPTGENDYKLEGSTERAGVTDTLAILLGSDKKVNITTSSAYSWNAEKTVDNQRINGDSSTTLKVYFDLGYKVVYFYRDSEESEYKALENSGYIYQKNNHILKPNAVFDGTWVTTGSAYTWNFAEDTVESKVGLFKDAFHTLYLYATGMVTPKDEGNINVTKQVVGNNTAQDYEFTLELTPEQVKGDRDLTTEEANELAIWNGKVSAKETDLADAIKARNTAVDEFMKTGVTVTTDSALKFARVDEDGNVYGLFDGDVTSPSALLYDFDSLATADATLMGEIAEFINGLTAEVVNDVTELFAAVKEAFSEKVDGFSLLFNAEKAQEMFAKVSAVTVAEGEYNDVVAERQAFLSSTKITKPAEVTLVAKYQDDSTQEFVLNENASDQNCYYDAASGKYIFKFTINASSTQSGWMSFDVQVASGSAINFVLKETGNGGADSTTVNNAPYTLDGVAEKVTSGSSLQYVFKNIFEDGSTPPPVGPVDPWPPVDPVDPPEVIIPDPEPPLVEPVDPTEPTEEITDPDVPLIDVPGEEVEIPEPEVPLGDAPKTGDANNAVPFVVLMMAAGLGLVITRRRFN